MKSLFHSEVFEKNNCVKIIVDETFVKTVMDNSKNYLLSNSINHWNQIVPVTTNMLRYTGEDSVLLMVNSPQYCYLKYLDAYWQNGRESILVSSLAIFDRSFDLKPELISVELETKIDKMYNSQDLDSQKLATSILGQYSSFLNLEYYQKYPMTSPHTLWKTMVIPWM